MRDGRNHRLNREWSVSITTEVSGGDPRQDLSGPDVPREKGGPDSVFVITSH